MPASENPFAPASSAAGAFGEIAEIIVLIAAVEDAEPGTNGRPAIRSPGQPEARSEILGVRVVIRRTLRAEAAAARDINHRRTVQDFVHHRVILIA